MLVLCAADGELEFEVDSKAELELELDVGGEDRVVVTTDVGRDVVTVSVAMMMEEEGDAVERILDAAELAEERSEDKAEEATEEEKEEAEAEALMMFVDITLMGLMEGLKKVTLAVAEILLTAGIEEERIGAVRVVDTGTTVGPLNVTDSVSVGMRDKVETSRVVEGRIITDGGADGDKDAVATLASAEDILGAYVPG